MCVTHMYYVNIWMKLLAQNSCIETERILWWPYESGPEWSHMCHAGYQHLGSNMRFPIRNWWHRNFRSYLVMSMKSRMIFCLGNRRKNRMKPFPVFVKWLKYRMETCCRMFAASECLKEESRWTIFMQIPRRRRDSGMPEWEWQPSLESSTIKCSWTFWTCTCTCRGCYGGTWIETKIHSHTYLLYAW